MTCGDDPCDPLGPDAPSRAGPCGDAPGTGVLADHVAGTILARVQPAVDRARRLAQRVVGVSPYGVALVWMRRNARQVFTLVEEFPLVPCHVEPAWPSSPELAIGPHGVNLEGAIALTRISPNLVTEAQLRGWRDGAPPPDDVVFFYEVTARRQCPGAEPGTRWRFAPLGMPVRGNTEWRVRLIDAEVPRGSAGEDRQLPPTTQRATRSLAEVLRR